MKATNVFIVLTLATAVCAAIGVGVYFNNSDDIVAQAQRADQESSELALSDEAFGPLEIDPGSPSRVSTDGTAGSVSLAADDDAANAIVALATAEGVETSASMSPEAGLVASPEATDETAVAEVARSIDVETLQAARVAFEQRDHDAVLELLGDRGPVEGSGYDVHYLRGLTLRYVGRFADSAREMDEALTYFPGSVRALVNSARTLIALEQFMEADERAQRAIELSPEDADAWNVAGRTKLNLQEYPAAIEAFDRAAALDPQNAHALNNKGYALLQQEQWQAAADALEAAIVVQNDVPWFHNNLGVCFEKLDRPAEAMMAWQRALELNPNYEKAAVSLARVEPRVEAIAAQLAGAGMANAVEETTEDATKEEAENSSDNPSDVEGEETLQAGSNSQPQADDVDVDGMEAGSDSRSNRSGSGATEETPEGSVSPQ